MFSAEISGLKNMGSFSTYVKKVSHDKPKNVMVIVIFSL